MTYLILSSSFFFSPLLSIVVPPSLISCPPLFSSLLLSLSPLSLSPRVHLRSLVWSRRGWPWGRDTQREPSSMRRISSPSSKPWMTAKVSDQQRAPESQWEGWRGMDNIRHCFQNAIPHAYCIRWSFLKSSSFLLGSVIWSVIWSVCIVGWHTVSETTKVTQWITLWVTAEVKFGPATSWSQFLLMSKKSHFAYWQLQKITNTAVWFVDGFICSKIQEYF